MKLHSKKSLVTSPVDQRGNDSLYTPVRGAEQHMMSMADILAEMKQASMAQSFVNDKVSVKEIMDCCNHTIGAAGDNVSIAKQELKDFNAEKLRTDDAMDRLMFLHDEYCD